MGIIRTIIKNGLTKRLVNIPEEYKEEYNLSVICLNIKNEKILSIILITIVMSLLFINSFASKLLQGNIYFFGNSTFYHIMLLIVASVFLMIVNLNRKISRGNAAFYKLLHLLYSTIVLTICSLIAINNFLIDKEPFAYIIAMLCMASMLIISYLESLVIYVFSYLIFICGSSIVLKNPYRLFEDVFFFTLMLILAIVVSYINYTSHCRNFINNKIINKKNQEIDNMYKLTEEALQQRTEELKETMEYENLRTAFFTNISHELRTPLNVIFSAEQMLELTLSKTQPCEKEKDVKRYIHIIKQNCYRLIRLIANLIDITKIDAGYLQVNFKNCDIVKIVEDITLSVADYIQAREVSLTFDTEMEEKVIACDPDKIERIMLNLLSNAVKFTPNGGNIFVNIYERDEKVLICVKDTGVGIPDEMKELIFERFMQVDRSTSRNREGSGIGLSIVKSLIELHGGSISLISEKGKGCEFIIEVPDRNVPDDVDSEDYNLDNKNHNVEKINIEFSDIYN